MVTTYIDSSVLVASYVSESRSTVARQAMAAVPQLPYTPLHHLEVRNAFRLLVGRKRLTTAESAAVLLHLEDDVAAGRLMQAPLDLYATFSRAEALSARHANRSLSRSLDILHVAAALELSCSRFISLDARQVRLAAACGLRAIDLT